MKHVIFYFSGTGNSLHVAKTLASELKPSRVQSMTDPLQPVLTGKYASIGFIYPTYFQGLPHAVASFVRRLDLSTSECDYFYGITTCGELQGNALPQLDNLLREKDKKLNYSSRLKMFSNYLLMYKMSKKVTEKTEKSDIALQKIVSEIQQKKQKKTRRMIPVLNTYHAQQIKRSKSLDRHYQVNADCVSCTLCQKVCPVSNIEMVGGKPNFLNHCEQCVACIHYCPKKAINYKKKTQNRGRYHHPDISAKRLIQSNSISE